MRMLDPIKKRVATARILSRSYAGLYGIPNQKHQTLSKSKRCCWFESAGFSTPFILDSTMLLRSPEEMNICQQATVFTAQGARMTGTPKSCSLWGETCPICWMSPSQPIGFYFLITKT
jgi:hypothetical protein